MVVRVVYFRLVGLRIAADSVQHATVLSDPLLLAEKLWFVIVGAGLDGRPSVVGHYRPTIPHVEKYQLIVYGVSLRPAFPGSK